MLGRTGRAPRAEDILSLCEAPARPSASTASFRDRCCSSRTSRHTWSDVLHTSYPSGECGPRYARLISGSNGCSVPVGYRSHTVPLSFDAGLAYLPGGEGRAGVSARWSGGWPPERGRSSSVPDLAGRGARARDALDAQNGADDAERRAHEVAHVEPEGREVLRCRGRARRARQRAARRRRGAEPAADAGVILSLEVSSPRVPQKEVPAAAPQGGSGRGPGSPCGGLRARRRAARRARETEVCTLVPRRRKRVARPAVLTSGVVQYADLDALEPFFLPEAFFLAAISPPAHARAGRAAPRPAASRTRRPRPRGRGAPRRPHEPASGRPTPAGEPLPPRPPGRSDAGGAAGLRAASDSRARAPPRARPRG